MTMEEILFLRDLEDRYGVIIVKEDDEYIVYENQTKQKNNIELCKEYSLYDLQTTLMLYLA